ncbi:hypothetical protein BGZ67_009000 [Mortierella alpina]|nr:hypothetical protein BGZ67_009000 [Mortierella alpina]
MQELDDRCFELMSRPLVRLLDYNPQLTRLEVPHGFFDIDGVSAAVSKLRHLQQLAVHCDPDEPSHIVKPFLCLQSFLGLPELTELTFFRGIDLDLEDDRTTVVRQLEAIILDAELARFSRNPTAKRIKVLRLPSRRSGIRNPLPLLLIKSNLLDLETCEIPWFGVDVTPGEIEQVVREHCPNLKHLECPQHFDMGQDGQAARAFIRGCSGLQSFTSAHFSEWPARGILSELVTHHYSTLEVLKLEEPMHVSSSDLQRVLSQCKRLKQFWVMVDEEDENMASIAFRDIFGSDWVCTELRELRVILNRCRSGGEASVALGEEEEHYDPRAWLKASTTKRAYQQIGRLKELEVLVIDIDQSSATIALEQDYEWDLTLRKGWLGEWADLKHLRRLELRADFWSRMDQREVEFMHKHWPKLDEIVFSDGTPEFDYKEPWQWLLQRRPNLRFRAV